MWILSASLFYDNNTLKISKSFYKKPATFLKIQASFPKKQAGFSGNASNLFSKRYKPFRLK